MPWTRAGILIADYGWAVGLAAALLLCTAPMGRRRRSDVPARQGGGTGPAA
ncbi:hypothetical protein ABZ621_28225 [Streptomyces sp. NPDC007863]|uniref:hypothetical protein n=1 Tax=Streptomyces sp. NPDC007863 TaxID=3154894 RepID=UPI0033F6E7B9